MILGLEPVYWVAIVASIGLLWLLIANLRNIIRARRSQSWASTSGRIIRSHFRSEEGGEDSSRYAFDIAYNYQVLGQTFTCDRVAFGLRKTVRTEKMLREMMDRYTAGTEVTVYYDPDDPTQAVLERGSLKYALTNIAVAGFAWALIIYFIWRNTQ